MASAQGLLIIGAHFAVSLAQLRGRDETFAREAVTEARSVAVEEVGSCG